MNNINKYGILEQNVLKSEIDHHLENLRIKGYSIIKNLLDKDEIENAKEKLDQIYYIQLKEFGEENLSKLNYSDITRALLVYDKFFLDKIALNYKVIEILNKIFNQNFILREQNGIINRPNNPNYQLNWHRDIIYQHFTSSRPVSISVLYCLDDFNQSTGGTYFLPYTHKIDEFPSNEYVSENQVCLNVSSGSAIIFDSMLFHRSGYNSSEKNRAAKNNVYTIPIFKQSVSLPKSLKNINDLDEKTMKILGFNLETDDSVLDWRNRRLK